MEDKTNEFNLHIAEYNALTTRCTYFTNIQNILLSALIVLITSGLLVFWKQSPEYIFRWGIIFAMLAIANISARLFYEENKIIKYIQNELLPTIKNLLRSGQNPEPITGEPASNQKKPAIDSFWNYQKSLFVPREDNFWYKLSQYSGVIIASLLILLIACTRLSNWNCIGDSAGIAINCIMLLFYFDETSKAVKTQKEWKFD